MKKNSKNSYIIRGSREFRLNKLYDNMSSSESEHDSVDKSGSSSDTSSYLKQIISKGVSKSSGASHNENPDLYSDIVSQTQNLLSSPYPYSSPIPQNIEQPQMMEHAQAMNPINMKSDMGMAANFPNANKQVFLSGNENELYNKVSASLNSESPVAMRPNNILANSMPMANMGATPYMPNNMAMQPPAFNQQMPQFTGGVPNGMMTNEIPRIGNQQPMYLTDNIQNSLNFATGGGIGKYNSNENNLRNSHRAEAKYTYNKNIQYKNVNSDKIYANKLKKLISGDKKNNNDNYFRLKNLTKL
jgi:hypothetical protein